jgi:hypothetical protein
MSFEPPPMTGTWYKNNIGESFEIVAQDEDDGTLELQYYDGTLEELDRDAWVLLNPEPIAPPEDWVGSMDLAKEDYANPEASKEPDDWLTELDRIDTNLD